MPGMEFITPDQRSSHNNTPLHHGHINQFYSSAEQPHSFTNSIISNHSQVSYLNSLGAAPTDGNLRRTPQIYTPTNTVGSGGVQQPNARRNHSRTQSPSVHSSGGGSIIGTVDHNSLSPALLSHHIRHFSDPRISSSSSGTHSNSITPPNSNSNTTISCGSGNSTSANIGVPTTPKATLNNNNNLKRQTQLDMHNFQNQSINGNTNSSNISVSGSNQNKTKAKKCILEEEDDDDDVEKCDKVCGAGGRIRTSWVGPNQEFLPICDALFNVISLAVYFCDIVFDILTAYTWYKIGSEEESDFHLKEEETEDNRRTREMMWQWSIVALVFIALSALLSQGLSYKWYRESSRRGQIGPDGVELEGPPPPCTNSVLVLVHVSFSGILWRYFKLFIPVDLRFVKNEVRDLCLLRLVHAFCEATPMLLIQLYLIWQSPGPESVSDFTVVSTSLSLFSVCWALASFSKNIRKQNVHKLVLTWLGVIFQFLWHLGTVISRVVALSLYATVYHFWIFLVLILHWFCMLMWLISPKTLYHGEKLSTPRKAMYSALIAVVYTFCYVNVQERNSRQKVIVYYVTMFLENTLLLSVWLIAKRYEDEIWYKTQVVSCVFGCFAGGIFFMCLYYRYFHLKKLSYVYDASSSIYRSSSMLNGGSSSVNMNGGPIYSTPIGKEMRGGSGACYAIESYGENVNDDEKTARATELGISTGNNLGGIIISNGSTITTSATTNSNTPAGPTGNQPLKKVPEKYLKRNCANDKKMDKAGNGPNGGQRGALYNKINGHHIHHPSVPGVFNCRFHPAMKRKKKKPTSFVPPPAVQPASSEQSPPNSHNGTGDVAGPADSSSRSNTGKLTTPVGNNGNHESENQIGGGGSRSATTHGNYTLASSGNGVCTNNDPRLDSTFRSQSDHENGVARNQSSGNYTAIDHHQNNIPNRQATSPRTLSPEYMDMDGGVVVDGCFDGSAGFVYGKMPISGGGGRSLYPFWKRPLSITLGSENEGSVSSRVDIQQKLQEKKKQQLAELREIEEEIKQGKLKRPQFNEIPQPTAVRQPIPVEKKQPWFRTDDRIPPMIAHPRSPFIIPNHVSDHEVILDPQYLIYASPSYEGSDFYDSPEWPINYYEPVYQNGNIQTEVSGAQGGGMMGKRKHGHNRSSKESIYKSYRMPSDIDSQMSLPRSYTLPREFKYRRKFRKPIKTEQFVPSTNSSDGKEPLLLSSILN
jgi:hypothetical protein